jgi:hypothetical protein
VEEEVNNKLLKRHHGTLDITKVHTKKRRLGSQDQQEPGMEVVPVKARSSLGVNIEQTATVQNEGIVNILRICNFVIGLM